MKRNTSIAFILATAMTCLGTGLSLANKPAAKKPANPKAAFEKLDADKSGAISLEEFKANAPDAEKAAARFATLDADKDGSLSAEEFGKAQAGKAKQKPAKAKKPRKAPAGAAE